MEPAVQCTLYSASILNVDFSKSMIDYWQSLLTTGKAFWLQDKFDKLRVKYGWLPVTSIFDYQ